MVAVYRIRIKTKFVCFKSLFDKSFNCLNFCPFLISDLIGRENNSKSFVKSLIQQEDKDCVISCQDELLTETPTVPHYYIFLPLSKSILKFSEEVIMNQVKSIKENPLVKQAFIWITPKNIKHPFIIPFVTSRHDTYVKFVDENLLEVTLKKGAGTIQKMVRRPKVFPDLHIKETFKSYRNSNTNSTHIQNRYTSKKVIKCRDNHWRSQQILNS